MKLRIVLISQLYSVSFRFVRLRSLIVSHLPAFAFPFFQNRLSLFLFPYSYRGCFFEASLPQHIDVDVGIQLIVATLSNSNPTIARRVHSIRTDERTNAIINTIPTELKLNATNLATTTTHSIPHPPSNMAATPSIQPSSIPPPAPSTQSAQPGQSRNRRRPGNRGDNRRRGGGTRGPGDSQNTNANVNATNDTQRNADETRVQNAEGTRPPAPSTDRGRGRGRGRGSRRGAPQSTRVDAMSGRRFGGQLTRAEDAPGAAAGTGAQEQQEDQNLRADAPAFVPGQVPQVRCDHTPHPSLKSKGKQRQPRMSAKSTADDMATRIHEDISNGLYECPICTSELGRRSKVWSCDQCWTVFHLSCIKKWSGNEGSVFARPREQQSTAEQENVIGSSSAAAAVSRQWRCPGCNLPHDILPSVYTCWCEKEMDPRWLPGLPPHSCGQTCSKSRKGCPHPCDLVCHAGPCPPCKSMGPTQYCFCGSHDSTKRCVDTDYENGWGCGEVCEEMLPCLEHNCSRPCHEGLCGECTERVDVRCYCGKVEKELRCSERGEEKSSENDAATWTGSFPCEATCGRLFDCGIHTCEKECHPMEKEVPRCPFSPDVVTHCPCGKTTLDEIAGYEPRTSCEDAVLNCKEPCEKILACGHTCPKPCHTGSCPPCFLRVDLKCRCGRSTFNSACQQGMDEPPWCFRVCNTSMSCGRHTCQERCCPGGRKSLERQATKRKLKSMNIPMPTRDDDVESEHICTRVCDRPLKCGKHTCPELCHKGACNSCREAIFEEISCNCGRTVLHPPLPCGTEPPACHHLCGRPKTCGHPQTQHNCHTDDESCPKCPYLTEKKCLCGKKTLKNQPCWHVDARCGLVCGKMLKCGSHTCTKNCHRPGDCEDATESCQQPCGKTKKICGHSCTDVCHAPFPCQERTPCQGLVVTTCSCGRIKQEKRCNASRDRTKTPAACSTPLKCDEECSRLQRNRSLASALKVTVNPATSIATTNPDGTPARPYSDETLNLYISLSSTSTLQTLQSYESALHSLALNTSTTQKSVRFQPVKKQLRRFTHSLAADWGFASESFDPDPNRHVLVYKSGGWTPPVNALMGLGVGIRGVSVGECVRMRERERAKEREAKRLAMAEKMRLESENPSASSGTDGDGWAQVVSRSKKGPAATAGDVSPFGFGETRNGTVTPGGRFGTLVLRSGVGLAKKKTARPAASDEEVADDWEMEVEKEEQEEQEQEKEKEKQQELTSDEEMEQKQQDSASDGEVEQTAKTDEETADTENVELPGEPESAVQDDQSAKAADQSR